MKGLKQFLATCESEALLADTDPDPEHPIPGGLGLQFGFPGDPKKLKDRSKTKLWKQYLQGGFGLIISIRFATVTLTGFT
jgi:hypothetical protein